MKMYPKLTLIIITMIAMMTMTIIMMIEFSPVYQIYLKIISETSFLAISNHLAAVAIVYNTRSKKFRDKVHKNSLRNLFTNRADTQTMKQIYLRQIFFLIKTFLARRSMMDLSSIKIRITLSELIMLEMLLSTRLATTQSILCRNKYFGFISKLYKKITQEFIAS